MQFFIFRNLLLIWVLKCFNLSSSPPPTRGNGKEKLLGYMGGGGEWTCLEIVLWSKSHLCCQKISSSIHRNPQWQLDAFAKTS